MKTYTIPIRCDLEVAVTVGDNENLDNAIAAGYAEAQAKLGCKNPTVRILDIESYNDMTESDSDILQDLHETTPCWITEREI